jgi:hypothetical protein
MCVAVKKQAATEFLDTFATTQGWPNSGSVRKYHHRPWQKLGKSRHIVCNSPFGLLCVPCPASRVTLTSRKHGRLCCQAISKHPLHDARLRNVCNSSPHTAQSPWRTSPRLPIVPSDASPKPHSRPRPCHAPFSFPRPSLKNTLPIFLIPWRSMPHDCFLPGGPLSCHVWADKAKTDSPGTGLSSKSIGEASAQLLA